MPCSKEALARLFYNVSSSFFLLLLFIYSSSILLLKFFHVIGSYPLIQRNQEEFEYTLFSDDEEEEEEDKEQEREAYYDDRYYHAKSSTETEHHLVADIIHGGDSLVFLHSNNNNSLHKNQQQHNIVEEYVKPEDRVIVAEDDDESFASDDQFSVHGSHGSEPEREHDQDDDDDDDTDVIDDEEKEIPTRDSDFVPDSNPNQGGPSSSPLMTIERGKSGSVDKNNDEICPETKNGDESNKEEENLIRDEKFLMFAPSKLESKKLQVQEQEDEGYFGDSCTNGSTSKSSSEWRSSINCRDSATEDPFSSSSRRSCPKWESYTVFQKYDEEMMFLDRISAQKLHETESLRSIQVCPRSISERIVHKLANINKKPSDTTGRHQNPYHELEGAYAAQICLTWEALNWNYKNFERKRAAIRDFDPGCPAQIAQHFQQFQVLLQRYVENEPYEQGRRPEIYARMRLLAPKLLLVPEYRDYEDDRKDDSFASRISSASFLMIMEDGIRTFMNFLKADKEKPCQILKSYFFGRNKRSSLDPIILNHLKKVNKKMKTKLEDLRRARKCIRKRRLNVEEEMEILMGLIDLKVVSRVLRMTDITEEQLHWCEEKMSKVRVLDGKLQRDSSPLFFPAH